MLSRGETPTRSRAADLRKDRQRRGAPCTPCWCGSERATVYAGTRWYELVILDLGTGVARRIAQFAISRADQLVLVTTPEWISGSLVLAALQHVEHERTTVACNKSTRGGVPTSRRSSADCANEGLDRSVAIPHDDQLAAMLDTATYQPDALERTSRTAIKRLGVAVARQLV